MAQRPQETPLEAILAKLSQYPCLPSNSNSQRFFQGLLAQTFTEASIFYCKGLILQTLLTWLVNNRLLGNRPGREGDSCPGVSLLRLSLLPVAAISSLYSQFPRLMKTYDSMLQKWRILQAVFVLILVYTGILLTEFSIYAPFGPMLIIYH